MAKIVMGIGMSHSPLLALSSDRWEERANDDRKNQKLNTIDGRFISYQELERVTGAPYGATATPEHFRQIESKANALLDNLAADLERVNPDVVVIIGDDHRELFSAANVPAIAIHAGPELVTHQWPEMQETWRKTVAVGYGMDRPHIYPSDASVGEHIIRGLIRREFDISATHRVDNPEVAGFGHAVGFVVERIFKGRSIPVVPVILNTYYPPNNPTPQRCYKLGAAIKECIEELPSEMRVAVVGSGGLSHMVVEEELDRHIIAALRNKDADALKSLPIAALKSGSSEILCWVAAAGAFHHLQEQWLEYIPVRRTPAGTGIGLAFGAWY